MKKEEVEHISPLTSHRISFICCFGYSVMRFIKKQGLNDVYWLKYENGDMFEVIRKDFFDFVDTRHGNVVLTHRQPELNPLSFYTMF